MPAAAVTLWTSSDFGQIAAGHCPNCDMALHSDDLSQQIFCKMQITSRVTAPTAAAGACAAVVGIAALLGAVHGRRVAPQRLRDRL